MGFRGLGVWVSGFGVFWCSDPGPNDELHAVLDLPES